MKRLSILYVFLTLLFSCSGADETGSSIWTKPDIPAERRSRKKNRNVRGTSVSLPLPTRSAEEANEVTKEKGLSKDYAAQDVIEMVSDLKPHRVERILTGYADENMQVPVREGEEPMTLLEFLNAVSAAGADGCDFAPKLNLNWLKTEKQADFFWDSAQKLYDMPLDRPIRTINLDCWNGYLDPEGVNASPEERSAMFKRFRDIGYTEIGVNMTGYVNGNDPEIDYVVFTLKKDSWTINEAALERVKSWPNIKQVFQYIDYPEPFTTFFTTIPPDTQADIYANNVVARQDELGIVYAWPILQGAWMQMPTGHPLQENIKARPYTKYLKI